jgi:hypothetical protein
MGRRPALGVLLGLGVLVVGPAGALAPATPARAHGIEHLVDEERELALPEVRRLIRLHDEVHRLLARYVRLERRVGRGWLEVVAAERAVERAGELVAEADARMDARIRAAYQFGPAGTLEALLGASSFAELAAISIYTERTLAIDGAALRASVASDAALQAERTLAQARRADLGPRLDELRVLLDVIEAKQLEALRLADAASIQDREMRELQAAIAAAAARQGAWEIIGGYGRDQSWLLSLLGPTGGRTCDTPEGLIATGESFDGYASWYGWEFGGQPTATGAIFDPRLFTAASRTLPFGTFLRVHHGGRCAVVLINDRGPYGRLERVIDLSEAAAKYLGVGVSWVHAEILVPIRSPQG